MDGRPDLSPEQLAVAEARLRDPKPGSKIAEARRCGVDLSLLIENLRLTPEERVRRMCELIETMEEVRGAARRGR
jgi:hypothetical protein